MTASTERIITNCISPMSYKIPPPCPSLTSKALDSGW